MLSSLDSPPRKHPTPVLRVCAPDPMPVVTAGKILVTGASGVSMLLLCCITRHFLTF